MFAEQQSAVMFDAYNNSSNEERAKAEEECRMKRAGVCSPPHTPMEDRLVIELLYSSRPIFNWGCWTALFPEPQAAVEAMETDRHAEEGQQVEENLHGSANVEEERTRSH
jgi:hypothetical protein